MVGVGGTDIPSFDDPVDHNENSYEDYIESVLLSHC